MSQGRSEKCHRFELMTLGEMGGHVARTGNMRIRYKLLDGRPKRKRPFQGIRSKLKIILKWISEKWVLEIWT